MGVFPEGVDATRQYPSLETRFLRFCKEVHVRSAIMDAVMWDTMRNIRAKFLDFLVDSSTFVRENA
jgi:hypothetical protein